MTRNTLALATIAALALGSSGCLASMIAGKVADMKIVDTGLPNPEGLRQFLVGAETLGCSAKVTTTSLGEDIWVKCPAGTFAGVTNELEFGFDEQAKTLKIGCDKGDRVTCDDPINAVLEAGRGKAGV